MEAKRTSIISDVATVRLAKKLSGDKKLEDYVRALILADARSKAATMWGDELADIKEAIAEIDFEMKFKKLKLKSERRISGLKGGRPKEKEKE